MRYVDLSPVEEALVCQVTAVTSVLRYEQLGYRGNVLNFTNDIAIVVRQLL